MSTQTSIHFEIEQIVRPTRIVVATDFTDRDKLIPHAIAQAKATGADVVLVHAVPPEIPPFSEGGGFFFPAEQRDDSFDQDLLAEMGREVEDKGIKCTTILRHGHPVDVIQEVIAEKEGMRLIMGSHGRGKLGQFALGSVAAQLIGRVAIPLFLVGPKCPGCSDRAKPKRILHPVSMNGEYRRSVAIAMELARAYGATVTMLHVTDRETERSMNAGLALSWAEKIFAELNPENGRPRPTIEVSVGFGDLVREIRKEASRIEADWIVLGVDEGVNLWPLMETTAYRTLAVTDCPVFAFRHAHVQSQREDKKHEVLLVNG